MRVGEALSLGHDDVDLDDGVLTIRDAKLDRQRLLPLHPSATAKLRAYAALRDRQAPTDAAAFFLSPSDSGQALTYRVVHHTFVALTTALGLRTASVRPRIHDLRHSFAVRTLIDWHRRGVAVEGQMAVLSTYLGHVHPAGTYWYLSATPELMELAAARLDDTLGGAS